jgi:hypothetical protein
VPMPVSQMSPPLHPPVRQELTLFCVVKSQSRRV